MKHLLLAAQLAWLNTINDPKRLIIRCSGITFAVILMFMQTGFRNALFDSNVRIMEKVDADFVIRSKARYMLSSGQLMPAAELEKALDAPGVVSVEPIYIETVASMLRKSGKPARKIRVIAFDVQSPTFNGFELTPNATSALQRGTTNAVADLRSKSIFHITKQDIASDEKVFGELADRQISLVGSFDLGIDFANNGNLIMTTSSFAQYFSFRGDGDPLTQVDYGVIRISRDANLETVRQNLQQLLGEYTRIDTKQEFINSERNYWGTRTPIGLIFMVGTIIGFTVGSIICYQVLATDISDHLGEFATLKAMGYSAAFFAAVVVFQALLMSLIAFLPGFLISLAAFKIMNGFTGLVMFMNVPRVANVLFLTIVMCMISGVIALRKLLTADPASLF